MAYDESEHNPGGASGGAGSTGKGGTTGGKGNSGGVSGGYNSTPNVRSRNPITGAALQNQADYANTGNTSLENVGNVIADMLGFHEMDPTKMNQKALAGGTVPQTQADWGFDPIGAALGVAGAATGLPLGTAYGGLRMLANKTGVMNPDWGMINMGPDVLGSAGKVVPGTKNGPGPKGTVDGSNGHSSGGRPIKPPVPAKPPIMGKPPITTPPVAKPPTITPLAAPAPAAMAKAAPAAAPQAGPLNAKRLDDPLNFLLHSDPHTPVAKPPIGGKPPVTKPPVTQPPIIKPGTFPIGGKPPVTKPIVGKPIDPPIVPLKPEPHTPGVTPVTPNPPVKKPPVVTPPTTLGGYPAAFYKALAKKLGYSGDPNQFQAWLKAHNIDANGNPITKPPVTKPPVTKPPVTPPVVTPPVTPPVVKPPTILPASWQAELDKFMPQLRSDFNWSMGQRGLNAKAPIGQVFGATNNDWENAYNNELTHRINEVPLGTTTLTDQAKIDAALNQYLLPNFGNSALDDYQTKMRSTMSNNPMLSGLQKGFDDKFSIAGVQPYLDQIYNTQYGQAKQLMDNTKARGEFNDLGYSSALKDLGDQGIAGKSKLSDLAQGFLTTDKGTLGDSLSGIYNKIGGYTLGSGYDPNSDVGNVNTQANTMYGNLKGQIMGAAPSIFDTSTTMQKAGTQQGMTSSGSLLDTLAQRNTSQQNRGLGSTGAF